MLSIWFFRQDDLIGVANKEVLYTTATGRFTFAAPFAPGEVAVVNYQDI